MRYGQRRELSSYEVSTALDFLMHYLPLDVRGKMMKEFPLLYNKLIGAEIMESVKKPALVPDNAYYHCE